jgi:uncharacterized membrane protein
MLTNIINEETFEFIKIIGLLFSVVHLLVGFILVKQMLRMNKMVRSRSSSFFVFIGFAYLGILALIVLGLVFLPTI